VPAVTSGHAIAPFNQQASREDVAVAEFNAQRMLGRMIKGAHRRLSADKEPPAQLPPRL